MAGQHASSMVDDHYRKDLLLDRPSSAFRKARMDRKGTVIMKGGAKKHRIVFADQLDKENELVDVYFVESYKKYNLENTYGNQNCCLLF